MYCPVCQCEYVAGVTFCADCQVDLVAELAAANPGQGAGDSSTDDSRWVLLWSGGDPRRQEELCSILEEEQIPARSSLEGGLLNLAAYASFDVYVPASLVPKATDVLRQVALAEEEWRRSGGAASLELPAEDDAETSGGSSRNATWYAEDATSEIWSGANKDLARMITASLRENAIQFRADPDIALLENLPEGSRAQKIFVLPNDEERAREIVQQIVDAVAP